MTAEFFAEISITVLFCLSLWIKVSAKLLLLIKLLLAVLINHRYKLKKPIELKKIKNSNRGHQKWLKIQ